MLSENTRLVFIKPARLLLILPTDTVYRGNTTTERLCRLRDTEPLQAQLDDFVMQGIIRLPTWVATPLFG